MKTLKWLILEKNIPSIFLFTAKYIVRTGIDTFPTSFAIAGICKKPLVSFGQVE